MVVCWFSIRHVVALNVNLIHKQVLHWLLIVMNVIVTIRRVMRILILGPSECSFCCIVLMYHIDREWMCTWIELLGYTTSMTDIQ